MKFLRYFMLFSVLPLILSVFAYFGHDIDTDVETFQTTDYELTEDGTVTFTVEERPGRFFQYEMDPEDVTIDGSVLSAEVQGPVAPPYARWSFWLAAFAFLGIFISLGVSAAVPIV